MCGGVGSVLQHRALHPAPRGVGAEVPQHLRRPLHLHAHLGGGSRLHNKLHLHLHLYLHLHRHPHLPPHLGDGDLHLMASVAQPHVVQGHGAAPPEGGG